MKLCEEKEKTEFAKKILQIMSPVYAQNIHEVYKLIKEKHVPPDSFDVEDFVDAIVWLLNKNKIYISSSGYHYAMGTTGYETGKPISLNITCIAITD